VPCLDRIIGASGTLQRRAAERRVRIESKNRADELLASLAQPLVLGPDVRESVLGDDLNLTQFGTAFQRALTVEAGVERAAGRALVGRRRLPTLDLAHDSSSRTSIVCSTGTPSP
jgi:hypothetical protein